MSEEILSGGNTGGAVRAGDTVRRPGGPWTPTVQRLLGHLRGHGLTWLPQPFGTDSAGRDTVSYLPGTVLNADLPDWVWADEVLVDAARMMSALHAATSTFDRAGAVWRIPVHEPAEVVCHNDFAPYNMVFTGRTLTGVIDWDTASPGPRVWDLAYLAYRLAPLTDPANTEAVDNGIAQRSRRLRLLCAAYGDRAPDPAQVVAAAVDRLHHLAAWTEARGPRLASHVALYRRDARWITDHTGALA
jgi:aminoglycoside phosphotransferase (APT) family kinase protein